MFNLSNLQKKTAFSLSMGSQKVKKNHWKIVDGRHPWTYTKDLQHLCSFKCAPPYWPKLPKYFQIKYFQCIGLAFNSIVFFAECTFESVQFAVQIKYLYSLWFTLKWPEPDSIWIPKCSTHNSIAYKKLHSLSMLSS